jgi:hypothetical protein
MPSRTLFGVHYIHDRRGYSDSVRSIGKAVVGRNGERQMRVPRFSYVVYVYYENRPDFRVSVGNLVTNQYEV